MSLFKMDTDKIRYLSNTMQRNANNFNMQMDSLKSAVEGADWQAQARDEFMMKFDVLVSANKQSTKTLEAMAHALNDKANQWDTIANVFNGPFQTLRGFWNEAKGLLSNTWNSVIEGISNINFPSIGLPSVSIGSIVGGIVGGWPDWDFNPPGWWPFGKDGAKDKNPILGPTPVERPDVSVPKPEPAPKLTHEEKVSEVKQEANIKLENVSPNNYKSCARYAAARRPDLGSTQSSNEWFTDQAAANYVPKFEEKSFQLNGTEGSLESNAVIQKGYAMVWEPGAGGANKTYGHVAIVEKVEGNIVTVSHAGWGGGNEFSLDYLIKNNIWFIGE